MRTILLPEKFFNACCAYFFHIKDFITSLFKGSYYDIVNYNRFN